MIAPPPPDDPPPPPVPVGRPVPTAKLTVVVEVDVAQVTNVSEVDVKANQPPFGAIGCPDVVAAAPSWQYAMFVVPALVTTTTLPAVNAADDTPPVVAVIGVCTDSS